MRNEMYHPMSFFFFTRQSNESSSQTQSAAILTCFPMAEKFAQLVELSNVSIFRILTR